MKLIMARQVGTSLLLLYMLIIPGQSTLRLWYYNNCSGSVWHGANPAIGEQMVEFAPGTNGYFEAPAQWTGSMWFRTGCSLQSLQFICETGDCGDDHEVPCDGGQPVYPVTLVNLAINGLSVRYEVSLIHGFNVPVTIQSDGACSSPIGCSHDLNKECPTKLMAKNSKGITVACRNACDALKDPSYCCTGATGACQPNKYSEVFKKFCPLAHVYPREDNPPIYECSASKNYTIVMCPAP